MPSKLVTMQTMIRARGDLINSCCADEGANADAILDSGCTSDILGISAGHKGGRYTKVTRTNEFDLEKGDFLLREYGHSLPIADGHPKILFVFMHGSHHAWNTV